MLIHTDYEKGISNDYSCLHVAQVAWGGLSSLSLEMFSRSQ